MCTPLDRARRGSRDSSEGGGVVVLLVRGEGEVPANVLKRWTELQVGSAIEIGRIPSGWLHVGSVVRGCLNSLLRTTACKAA